MLPLFASLLPVRGAVSPEARSLLQGRVKEAKLIKMSHISGDKGYLNLICLLMQLWMVFESGVT